MVLDRVLDLGFRVQYLGFRVQGKQFLKRGYIRDCAGEYYEGY